MFIRVSSCYARSLSAADRSIGVRSYAELQSVVRPVIETNIMEPPQRHNRPFFFNRDGAEVAPVVMLPTLSGEIDRRSFLRCLQ